MSGSSLLEQWKNLGAFLVPKNAKIIQFPDGAAITNLSPSGQAFLRYNDSTKTFEASVNGGAYIEIGGAVTVQVLAIVPGIDLTTIGTTALYTVPAGKELHVIDGETKITASVDLTGDVHSGIDDFTSENWGFTVPVPVGKRFSFANGTNSPAVAAVYPAGTVINYNVISPATVGVGGSFIGTAYLVGYLV